jgi:hypothetical protein
MIRIFYLARISLAGNWPRWDTKSLAAVEMYARSVNASPIRRTIAGEAASLQGSAVNRGTS